MTNRNRNFWIWTRWQLMGFPSLYAWMHITLQQYFMDVANQILVLGALGGPKLYFHWDTPEGRCEWPLKWKQKGVIYRFRHCRFLLHACWATDAIWLPLQEEPFEKYKEALFFLFRKRSNSWQRHQRLAAQFTGSLLLCRFRIFFEYEWDP